MSLPISAQGSFLGFAPRQHLLGERSYCRIHQLTSRHGCWRKLGLRSTDRGSAVIGRDSNIFGSLFGGYGATHKTNPLTSRSEPGFLIYFAHNLSQVFHSHDLAVHQDLTNAIYDLQGKCRSLDRSKRERAAKYRGATFC